MRQPVKVTWFSRTVEIPEAEWRACRRIENAAALVALLVAGGLFIAGLEVSGLIQVAGLVTILTGLAYFDGWIARWCAVRKAAGRPQ